LSPEGQTRFGQLNETLDAHAQRVMARIPRPSRSRWHTHLRYSTSPSRQRPKIQHAPHLMGRNSDGFLEHTPCNTTRLAQSGRPVGDSRPPPGWGRGPSVRFFLAFRDDVLISSAGLERYGDTALLRSVVAPTTSGNEMHI
jgi:hypothetical protein